MYVCRPPTETPTGKYLGTCHFQRLLREPPSTLISSLLDISVDPVRPDTPLADVTRDFAAYNLVAVPVVDEDNHLVGAVTIDDVVDHMLPGELARAGGTRPGGGHCRHQRWTIVPRSI